MPECVAVPPPPATAARGADSRLLGRADAGNAVLCGGKAAGLARLRRAGFPVPDGICLTTEFCRTALREIDVAARVRELVTAPSMAAEERSSRLAGIRRLIEGASLPAHMVETI